MARPRYKITEIGEIPQEWEISKLSKIFKIFTGTTPSTKIGKYWYNGSVEWLTPKDLSRMADTIILPPSERKITPEAVKQFGLNLIPEESILISTRAPVGYVGINKIKITFNQGCKGLVPIEHGSNDSSFYAYYLKYIRNFLVSVSGGSTFKELSKERLASLDVPIPPLSEQQKIAEILSTADYAIQRVDEQITLSESLKKGLMQTLLIKGIGHTKFKVTEIGEIPDTWNVKELYQVSELRREMIEPMEFITEHYVGLENIPRGKLRIISYGDASNLKSSKFKFKKYDILYGKLRPYLDKVALAETDGVCSTDIIPIVSKNSDARFLAYMLHSDSFLQFAKSTISGTNHPRTAWKQMSHFKLPFPSISEQQKIAEILLTVDEKLGLLKGRRDHLEKLKKVLMNDLLTGKVRIKIESSGSGN
jgi:type I restriction enzyme S subunit